MTPNAAPVLNPANSTNSTNQPNSPNSPNSPKDPQKELGLAFLGALIEIESDEISLKNATVIRDSTDAMEAAIRDGLEASKPFVQKNFEDITPLGYAAQVLRDMAFSCHLLSGRAVDDPPNMNEVQCQEAAAQALRKIVVATLETAGVLKTTPNPAGDGFQSLNGLCAPNDIELIERCLQAGLDLTPDYLGRIDLDLVNRMLLKNGPFFEAFEKSMADPDPVQAAAFTRSLNRADALAKSNGTALHDISPALSAQLEPVTIDAALELCVKGKSGKETVAALLALGANPLGAHAIDATQPTALWHAMKDAYGVEAALLLAPLTPNANETHGGQDLLTRAVDRRCDPLIAMLAGKGAKFSTPEIAQTALINGAEQGLIAAIDAAISQGADVNGIEKIGTPRTALISAGMFDHPKAVELLLSKGADPMLEITKYKMSRDAVYEEIKTNFFDETLRSDSVHALHAAVQSLGVGSVNGLKANDRSPLCKTMLSGIEATGALSPLAGDDQEMDLNGLMASLQNVVAGIDDATSGLGKVLEIAKIHGIPVTGIGPGGGSINLGF